MQLNYSCNKTLHSLGSFAADFPLTHIFHPVSLSISPVLWHNCQRVFPNYCTSARHAGRFDCLMGSLILIAMGKKLDRNTSKMVVNALLCLLCVSGCGIFPSRHTVILLHSWLISGLNMAIPQPLGIRHAIGPLIWRSYLRLVMKRPK